MTIIITKIVMTTAIAGILGHTRPVQRREQCLALSVEEYVRWRHYRQDPVCMYVHMYVKMYICMYTLGVRIQSVTYRHSVHACMHTHIKHTYLHKQLHTHVNRYMHAHTHTHIHIHKHMHIHIQCHTQCISFQLVTKASILGL